MLLRDHFKPASGYKHAIIHLAGDYSFYCEQHAERGFTAWLMPGRKLSHVECLRHVEGQRVVLESGDEFEAQAVLDHYVQTMGLAENNLVLKPSRDT